MFKRLRHKWRTRHLKYITTVPTGGRISYSPKANVHILERPVRDWLYEQGQYLDVWYIDSIVPNSNRLTFKFKDRNTMLFFKLIWGGV